MFDLNRRVAVITGGSSGIGKANAHALGSQGAKFVLMARRLAERDALKLACAEAARPYGALAILVNCAGINIRRPFPDLTDADWDATMAINLAAPFFVTRALAPAMKAQG